MRALPEALNRPVMVFASKTQQGAMVMLTEMFDGNGKPVVAAVHFERRQGRVMVNRIASAYGRNLSQIRASLNATDTLYVDNEKAPAWATTVGLQLPWVVQPSARAAPKFKTEADLVQFRKAEVGAVDSANPDIAFSRSGGLLDTLRTSATKKGMSDLFNDSMTSRRRRESPALRKQ